MELAVGIAAAVYKTDFEGVLKDTLRDSMENYYGSKTERLAWDNLQVKLECCGVDGPNDWPEKQRPFSCCHRTERRDAKPPETFHCVQAEPGDDILYSVGCFEKLQMKANSGATTLIGVGIGIAFIEISGIGIITAGAIVLADIGEFSHFMENRMLATPIVLIVAGTIIFIIAFLGCFGAIRESHSLLMAFAICLLIIFIIELAVGIAAAVFKNDFEDALKNTLKNSMKNYNTNNDEKTAWDNTQKNLMCCGVEGPADWNQNQLVKPESCCKDPKKFPNCENYEMGCYTQLKLKVENKATILIGVGIGIAFVQSKLRQCHNRTDRISTDENIQADLRSIIEATLLEKRRDNMECRKPLFIQSTVVFKLILSRLSALNEREKHAIVAAIDWGANFSHLEIRLLFAISLLIIFITELAVGIAAAVFRNDFQETLKNTLNSSLKNYKTDDYDKTAWDNIQNNLMCCGVESEKDWRYGKPSSCCKDLKKIPNGYCMSGFYETGCFTKLILKFESKLVILIGVGIGVAFLQIAGIVLVRMLVSNIEHGDIK
ncbi:hypothetical protein FQR65_LT07442 [Abscondita terminalis]|nr:hypothetical protein FQR65_LT07442 [Abscondita terminalis]